MERRYRCPVTLAIFVVGCYGEIIKTSEHNKFQQVLGRMRIGKRETRTLINKCAYSAAVSTTNILMRRSDGAR